MVIANVDRMVLHDLSSNLVSKVFENEMGGGKIYDPSRIVFVFDHTFSPATQADADAAAKRFWQRSSWYRRAEIRNRPLAGQPLIDELATQGPVLTAELTEAEAEAYAIDAILTLRDIAISGNTAYQLTDAEGAMLTALEARSGGLRLMVADILALMDSQVAQAALGGGDLLPDVPGRLLYLDMWYERGYPATVGYDLELTEPIEAALRHYCAEARLGHVFTRPFQWGNPVEAWY